MCDHFHAHNPLVITDSSAMRWVQSALSIHHFLLHLMMVDPHHSFLISLKDNPQSLKATLLPHSNSETWSKGARCLPRDEGVKQLTQKNARKSIAALKIANLFSLYITLAGTFAVARDVHLRYNANGLYISSPRTHDVNFTCFLQSVAFCVASSVQLLIVP
ncbi:hypothetical protein TNCV_4974371 [Trichonephila clavipes]|uniref:Uncharacterized protein n=1 Tax=Trichonephila clavipes TaxID=2585209 RepID=A0A8X6SMW0_TRICX|nr:hypothetical protein TNCV_4974371 [Trichonephila clavipes]